MTSVFLISRASNGEATCPMDRSPICEEKVKIVFPPWHCSVHLKMVKDHALLQTTYNIYSRNIVFSNVHQLNDDKNLGQELITAKQLYSHTFSPGTQIFL